LYYNKNPQKSPGEKNAHEQINGWGKIDSWKKQLLSIRALVRFQGQAVILAGINLRGGGNFN